jgi:hypothetical protein
MQNLIQHPDTVARHKMWSRHAQAAEAGREGRVTAGDLQEKLSEEAPYDDGSLEPRLVRLDRP